MKGWDIKYCGSEAFYLDKIYINLFQEVLGVIDELERIDKSISKKLLMCSKKIKWKFDKKNSLQDLVLETFSEIEMKEYKNLNNFF